MTLAGVLALGWWLAGLVAVLGTAAGAIATIYRLNRDRQPPPSLSEGVSVVMPFLGLDHRFDEALVSVFDQAGVDLELIAASEDPFSPGLTRARNLAGERGLDLKMHAGLAGEAVSPKLDTLIPAIRGACHDIVVVRDSNVTLAPGQIAAMVGQLREDVGLVCAVPVVDDVVDLGGEVEAAFINGFHARVLRFGQGLGFGAGIGKVMVFRRSALDRAGGITAIASTIAEDHAAAKAFARAGLSVRLSDAPARQRLGPRTLGQVWDRHLRWMTIHRRDEPIVFLAELLFGAPMTLVAAAIAASSLGWSIPLALLTTTALLYGAEAAHARREGWTIGVRHAAAWAIREAMIPALWVAALFAREVVWGGRLVGLDRDPRHAP